MGVVVCGEVGVAWSGGVVQGEVCVKWVWWCAVWFIRRCGAAWSDLGFLSSAA